MFNINLKNGGKLSFNVFARLEDGGRNVNVGVHLQEYQISSLSNYYYYLQICISKDRKFSEMSKKFDTRQNYGLPSKIFDAFAKSIFETTLVILSDLKFRPVDFEIKKVAMIFIQKKNATKTVRDLYQWICMITRLKLLER